MRVLVTGGSGYIGSHTVRELARQGHEVVIYDNLSTGHAELSRGFPLVVGDIADQARLEKCLEGVDLVMHFAASAYVGESMLNPRKYFENNVQSGLRLVESLLKCNVMQVVFSSTCAVYGTPTQLPIVESSPKEPINPYGDTKLFFERVLAAYARSHGLRYVALRYFNAAGAALDGTIGESHNPETHIIPLALRAAMRTGARLNVFGGNLPTPDGTCIRDFIHVEDLARAHAAAAAYLGAGGAAVALNLGTGKGTSLRELLAEVRRVTGHLVPHNVVKARPGDPPTLYANALLAEEVLGWRAKHDLGQMIDTAYAWERNSPAARGISDMVTFEKASSYGLIGHEDHRTDAVGLR
jgi:UDP-arabinose 4-epimerase